MRADCSPPAHCRIEKGREGCELVKRLGVDKVEWHEYKGEPIPLWISAERRCAACGTSKSRKLTTVGAAVLDVLRRLASLAFGRGDRGCGGVLAEGHSLNRSELHTTSMQCDAERMG